MVRAEDKGNRRYYTRTGSVVGDCYTGSICYDHFIFVWLDTAAMAYPIDPMRAKYYPEIFGEAGVTTTTASGEEIASYSNYSDNIVQLVTLGTHTDETAANKDCMIRVAADSGTNLIDENVWARPQINNLTDLKITGKESMLIDGYFASGGAASTMRWMYGVRVTKPTVFEKIMLGMRLSETEQALSTKFDIGRKIQAGVLSARSEEQYIKIYEVAKSMTIASGVNGNVGQVIHPLNGQKAVLLGVAVERHGTAAQVYLSVDRDDEQVMQLDTNAFVQDLGEIDGASVAIATNGSYGASMSYELPLHVVALDKLRVWIENPSSAVDTFKVRFKYGIATLSLMDRIRWNLGLNDDEMAIANEMDLFDSVTAGVM